MRSIFTCLVNMYIFAFKYLFSAKTFTVSCKIIFIYFLKTIWKRYGLARVCYVKVIFIFIYHWKSGVQTRDWHWHHHRPSYTLGKPLSIFESKYVQQLIFKGSPCAYKFHGTSRFIDDPCTENDDGEFSPSYKYIYSKQLELKLKHQVEHVTFLNLNITIVDNIFVYKLFDKRDKFFFFIVPMPDLSNNIPSSIFYGNIFRLPTHSLMYTNNDRFCAQGI